MSRLFWFLPLLFFLGCKNPKNEASLQEDLRSREALDRSIDAAREMFRQEEAKIQEYIERSGQEFTRTPYGFWFRVEGDADSLTGNFSVGDTVRYESRIETLDGECIYSSQQRGRRFFVVERSHEIAGLHYGIRYLQKGQSAVFLFPSYMAYGFSGDGNRIKGGWPIVFYVTTFSNEEKSNN